MDGTALRDALLEPVVGLLGPHHRVYAPFVFASMVVAALTRRFARGARGPRASLLRYLFPRRIFLHGSSRFDVVWLPVRGVCQALLAWPLRVSVLGVALVVCGALRDAFGPSAIEPPADRTAIFVTLTIVLFLFDDLTRYLLHRTMHAVPALWELHKVHHSAEVLTPLTLYRVHPIESAANQLRGILVSGIVTGVFVWAFPGKLRAFEILGVDALGFLWTLAGANLRHSHVWLRFPAAIERWFVSPAQHQLHHARSGAVGNYGSTLSVWDRAFGTLVLSESRRPPRVGLPRSERNHDRRVLSALVDPMLAALRRLVPRRLALRALDVGGRELP